MGYRPILLGLLKLVALITLLGLLFWFAKREAGL